MKFKFMVSTHKIGSEIEEIVEIDDEELEGLSDGERDRVIGEYYDEWRNEQLYGGWEEA